MTIEEARQRRERTINRMRSDAERERADGSPFMVRLAAKREEGIKELEGFSDSELLDFFGAARHMFEKSCSGIPV